MRFLQKTKTVKSAVDTLASAFLQDPFMRYVFPDDDTREQQLTTLIAPVLKSALMRGGVDVIEEGEGVAAWVSGRYFSATLPQLIRSGLIWIPFQIGAAAFDRLEKHDKFCDFLLAVSPGAALTCSQKTVFYWSKQP